MKLFSEKTKGFTLIEIIMSMLLTGVVIGIGSIGITSFSKSFVTSKDAVKTAGTAQLAMLRIAKEFIAIKAVTAATASSITFQSNHADGLHTFTFSLAGNNLQITEGGNTDTLANGVTSFALDYLEWSYVTDTLVQTVSNSDADGPGFWVNADICCNTIDLTISYAECDNGELKVKFEDDINGTTPIYNVTYAGAANPACVHSSTTHYHASNTNGFCGPKEVLGQNWYDKAYIWNTTNGAKCYAETTVINDAGDPCAAGGGANTPPYALRGGTKIIKATVVFDGAASPFTISAAPRNIDNCP